MPNPISNGFTGYFILHGFYILSQILQDGNDFSVMFKETMYIAEHIIDSSLFQALQHLVFLKMNSVTWFF